MSIERTAAALLLPGFLGQDVPTWVSRWIEDGLGGVTLYGRNVGDPGQLAALTDRLHQTGEGLVVAIDEEGGDVTRLDVATGSVFPGNAALGVVDDVALTEAVGGAMGARLAAIGIDLDLAPVADVNVDPDNPVIGIRSFGTDPALVSRHIAAFVHGLQSTGVAACLKHFPGHGNTHVDSHRSLPVVEDSAETIGTVALPPFSAGFAAGAKAVMTAHLLIPAYDDVPATISRRVLTGLLREELGFTGVVVSDGLDMAGLTGTVGFLEGAVRCLAAGADLLCTGGGPADEETVTALVRAIAEAVHEGRLSPDALEASAQRVRELGLWSAKHRNPAAEAAGEGRALARSAAERALRVTGDVRIGRGAALVRLDAEPNDAVGRVPWGLGEPMSLLDPGVERVTVDSDQVATASLLGVAAGRPLVVVTRDLHRIAWQQRILGELAAVRPDLVVVEMGLPYFRPEGVRGHLATWGAARVNADAAAALLLRQGTQA